MTETEARIFYVDGASILLLPNLAAEKKKCFLRWRSHLSEGSCVYEYGPLPVRGYQLVGYCKKMLRLEVGMYIVVFSSLRP